MRRIEFKAYGGTGTLIGRSFLALLALNAGDVARKQCKDDKCVIYQMDYDDETPQGTDKNDSWYFRECISNYIKLNQRDLGFIAPIKLELSQISLKSVRDFAYPNEEVYSLHSLFCTGKNQGAIKELLSAAFTTGSESSEMQLSNAHGCYGDLAVNGFISERIIDTNAFKEKGVYAELVSNLQDAMVFYAGSTDGGTANTMIDKDIRSLLHYLKNAQKKVDHDRSFRLYGLRTTPYSRFQLTGTQLDVEVTEPILRNKFEMSKGVLDNIDSQNQLALKNKPNSDTNDNIDSYSYYRLNEDKVEYWLDGLFVAGSETLDLTSWVARKDNQFHPTHFTELSLAMQAMDAIAYRLPAYEEHVPCIYGYNDGANSTTREDVTLQSFFNGADVSYDYEIYDNDQESNSGSFSLYKYVRAILLTLVTIKGEMIRDFRDPNTAPPYVGDIFVNFPQVMANVCPLIADELEKFLAESKFIVMVLYDAMTYSKFGGSSPIKLMEEAVRFLYSSDTLNNPITTPAGNGLSILADDTGYTIELSTDPYFVELEEMHTRNYHPGGIFAGKKKKLVGEQLYQNCGATSDGDAAQRIANNMIRRTFETYLASL